MTLIDLEWPFSVKICVRLDDHDTTPLQTDGQTTWLGTTALRYASSGRNQERMATGVYIPPQKLVQVNF